MKMLSRPLITLLFLITVCVSHAATTFKLTGLFNFGGSPNNSRFDGSIQPGDSIGISPATGLPVYITALPVAQPSLTNTWNPGETNIDARPSGSTNGFNNRGITTDPDVLKAAVATVEADLPSTRP